MRKYITLIISLAILTLFTGLDAQTGRRSGLTGGINAYVEQTDFDSLHVGVGKLVLGNTASGNYVTATADELNVLDGIAATLTSDELDYLDIATLGTQEASKVVTTNSDSNSGVSQVTQLWIGSTGAETQVTATPDELNVLDGIAATLTSDELDYNDIAALGTGAPSKAVVLSATGAYTWPAADTLFYAVLHDGTNPITSTAAELNALPATTASAAELDYVAGVTAGTGVADKAMVLDVGEDFTWPSGGILTYGGSTVTSTGTELSYTDITALGTQEASKVVTTNSDSNSGISKITQLWIGSTGAETQVTATATELNYTDITTLGTQEASKVVTTNSDSNSGVSKITELWIGSTGAEVQVASTALELDQRALTVKMIDVSSAGQVHVVSPYTGNVTAVYSVLNATIATAPAGITIKDKDGNVMGTITIADGGSGPGDVDSDVSISNADVAVGDMIEIETDNASTNTVEVEFTILIAIQ